MVEPDGAQGSPRAVHDRESIQDRRPPLKTILVLLIFILIGLAVLLLLLWNGDDALPAAGGSGLESLLVLEGPGTGDTPRFDRPLAAAYGPTGEIYVSDTGNGRVCVFTERGRFKREFGRSTTGTPDPKDEVFLSQPAGLAVDDDGTVYVADLRLGAVLVYDRRGNFLRALGSTFALRVGGALRPTDVAVSDESVAIAGAAGVVILSTAGDLKRTLTEASPGSPFIRPNGVAFAPDGSLLVSDTNNARIVSLQPDGERLWVFDKSSSTGNALALGLPRGIAAAEDGSILVADAFRFSIVRISTDGEFVDSWGEQGSAAGSFEFPNDVDVRGDRLLVADKENHRVQVLRVTAGLSAPEPAE